MSMVGEVHWHEGLFLQPHHLQTMQRHLLERFGSERRLAMPYAYGVVESRLSADALENMLIQFDRLRAVMPSGIEVSVPEHADLPALDIKDQFESGRGGFTVYLGVPLWFSERANAVDRVDADWRVKRVFKVTEVDRPDENTGENPQPVPVRRVNARLLLDKDDHSDMEVLPILRVVQSTGEAVGLPRQDPQFMPPCLVTGGSTVMRDLLRDLANQVEASRKELVIQINRGGFSVDKMRGVQFEQMLRLQILNRFSARLPHLAQCPVPEAPRVSPFTMYLELRQLLGELAALYPDRDQFEVAAYDHDAPALVFFELASKIRALLRGSVKPSFIRLPFQLEAGLLVAALTDEHLTRPTDYFLGIKTREDALAVAKLVEDPDKFKLMARSLGARAIWGVRLVLERLPPLELPSEAGLIYFRLQRGESQRMWERIVEEKAIAARWPGMEAADLQLALYMTVPNQEAGT